MDEFLFKVEPVHGTQLIGRRGISRSRYAAVMALPIYDRAFFFVFLVFLVFAGFLQSLGAIAYLAFCAACALYAVPYYSKGLSRGLIAFSVVGLFYVAISYAEVLPKSWTVFFVDGWILRQGFFVVMFPIHLISFRYFWLRINQTGSRDGIIDILFAVSAFAIVLFRFGNIGDVEVTYNASRGVIYALPNLMTAVVILILCGVEIAYRARTYAQTTVILFTTLVVVLLTSGTTQIVLAGLAVCGLSITIWPRVATAIAYVGFFGLFLLVVWYAPGELTSDRNTWIRMAFWQDALKALKDTLWMGVGFGTEAVTNRYVSIGKGDYFFEQERLAGQSIHNSFLYVFFRMGFLGGGAFLFISLVECFPRSMPDYRSLRLALISHFVAILCLFVNVGLESPFFVVGVCWALGLILGNQDAYLLRMKIDARKANS